MYNWSPVAKKPQEHVEHYAELLGEKENIPEEVMERAKRACTSVGACSTTLHANTFKVGGAEVNKVTWQCSCGKSNCWHVVAIKLHILGPVLTRENLFAQFDIEPSEKDPVF